MSEPPVSGCWASSRSNRRGHPGERVTRGVTVIGHPAKAVGRASIRPTCGPGWSAGSPCTSRTDLDQDTPHNCGRSACRRVTTRTRTTGPTTLPASPRPATTNSHSLSRPRHSGERRNLITHPRTLSTARGSSSTVNSGASWEPSPTRATRVPVRRSAVRVERKREYGLIFGAGVSVRV